MTFVQYTRSPHNSQYATQKKIQQRRFNSLILSLLHDFGAILPQDTITLHALEAVFVVDVIVHGYFFQWVNSGVTTLASFGHVGQLLHQWKLN